MAAGGAQRGSERPLPRCTATPAQAGTRTTAEARMPSEPECRGGGKAERGRSAKRRRNAPLCPARDLARGTTTSPLTTGSSPVGGHLTRTHTSSRHGGPRPHSWTRRQRLTRIPPVSLACSSVHAEVGADACRARARIPRCLRGSHPRAPSPIVAARAITRGKPLRRIRARKISCLSCLSCLS